MNWTLHCGEARAVLATLPDASVQCCLSSPPYWGLRDYGTATWEGGDPACDHISPPKGGGHTASTLGPNRDGLGPDNAAWCAPKRHQQFRELCRKCGARRIDQQIGLESSPDAYVAALVGVYREVKRVLADDGVCWLNLGDSYTGQGGGAQGKSGQRADRSFTGTIQRTGSGGMKPKDLIGIPWRVAFALQADGWYLRSDVIWNKTSCMPESVTDRPTRSHEYVFLLTKSERYAYDADAIRTPLAESTERQIETIYEGKARKAYEANGVQNPSDVKSRIVTKLQTAVLGRARPSGIGANARTVWTLPTENSDFEHFAVMPKALARRCILAGCAAGKTVLDPFAGVATTGVVALEEGRSFVGIELNHKYHALARSRLANAMPLLATEVPA